MNPLSKAFVILVTLLTVALSCLSIAVIGRQENYKKNLDDVKAKLEVAQAQLKTSEAKTSGELDKMNDDNSQLIRDKVVLQTNLIAANENASKAQFNLNKANADLESANASLKIATASMDRATQEREAYAQQYIAALAQVHEEGKKGVESNSRIAELSDKLRRTEIDLIRFKEASMAANKQVEESAKQVSQLEGQLGKEKLPTTVTVAATQTIQGAVTTVGAASNGVTLVSVNVGEKDQVVPGMQFTINRGADYVGTMVVTTVNTETSVGRVMNSAQPIASGDAVYIRGYNRLFIGLGPPPVFLR